MITRISIIVLILFTDQDKVNTYHEFSRCDKMSFEKFRTENVMMHDSRESLVGFESSL